MCVCACVRASMHVCVSKDKGRIFVERHGSYDMYYGEVTLGYKVGYVTMKTTCNYALYLFGDSLS